MPRIPSPAAWLLLLLGAPALADTPVLGETHAGIAIVDLQALHVTDGKPPPAPAFGTAATGWSLVVDGGIVFVFVGRSPAAAQAWTELQLSRQRSAPLPVEQPVDGVEAAWRRGTDFYLLRDGNIGIMVQGTTEAAEEAALVRGLIRSLGPPWPTPPRLVPEADGTWRVDAGAALHVAWQGGQRVAGSGRPLRFTQPPDKLVRWDELGRAAVWRADDASAVRRPEGDAPSSP